MINQLNIKFSDYLLKSIPNFIQRIFLNHNDIIIYTDERFLLNLLIFLKNHTYCQFNVFTDLLVVDYPNKKFRFEVIYNLLSTHFNKRIIIKVEANQLTFIPSATKIFPGINWYEREAWDMFGIAFDSHPDLRRILTDYGFEGYPLRKDFPLTGFVETRYSETQKKIILEPVSLSQEYRKFSLFSGDWPKDQFKIKKI